MRPCRPVEPRDMAANLKENILLIAMCSSLLTIKMVVAQAQATKNSASAIFIHSSSMMPITGWAQVEVALNVSQQTETAETLASNSKLFLEKIPDDIKDRHKWSVATMRVNHWMLTEAIRAVKAEDRQIRRRAMREMQRQRRGVNIGLKLNVNKAITSIFDGISNIFHGSSLKKLKLVTTKVVHRIQAMEVRLEAQANAIRLNQIRMLNFTHTFLRDSKFVEALMTASNQMSTSTTNLDLITAAAGIIANGQVPSTMVTPTQVEEALKNITEQSAKWALRPAVSTPLELYTLPASVMVSNGHWLISIHVPLVDVDQIPLQLWEIHPMVTDSSSKFLPDPKFKYLAIDQEIAVDTKVYRLSEDDKNNNCIELQKSLVCHSIVALRDPKKDCLTTLFTNASDSSKFCRFRTMTPEDLTPKIVGSDLIFFANEEVEINIFCRNQSQISKKIVKAHGFNVMEMQQGCTFTTRDWTFVTPETSKYGYERRLVKAEWSQDFDTRVMSEVVEEIQDQLDILESTQDQIQKNLSSLADYQDQAEELALEDLQDQDEDEEWDDGDIISISFAACALAFTSVLVVILVCGSYKRKLKKMQTGH